MRNENWHRLLPLAMFLCVFSAACQGPAWENELDVKEARIACAGLKANEHYLCVVGEALASMNPDVCHLTGINLDDLCLQTVYEAANDPAICDRLYLQGMPSSCRSWYAQPTPRLGLLEARHTPESDPLRGCAEDTVRDLTTIQQLLATGERRFSLLCQTLGKPDWQVDTEWTIYIYELADGSEVRIGLRRTDTLSTVFLVTPDRRQIDLLAD